MILKYLKLPQPQKLPPIPINPLFIVYLVIIGLLCFSYTTHAQVASTDTKVIDEILAKVDNYIVLKSELENTYRDQLAAQQVNSGGVTKCRVLESLVISKMMLAKAEIDSVLVSDDEVNGESQRRMQYLLGQMGGSEEELEKLYGKSLGQIQEELQDQIKEQLVIQKMQREITTDIEVTPAEVKKFFNRLPQDSLPYYSAEASVAQIVKRPIISKAQKEVTRKQLLDIRERILNGESFEELAKKYSEDPGSAPKGGNLGFTDRGTMVPEFEAAAMKLKPGELSQPIESQFGFHLIELIERRGNRFNSKHILLRPVSSASDIQQAERFLDSLRTLIIKDSISFEKAAKENSDDSYTAASGGFFIGSDGSNRVPTEELDPVVFFTVDTMKVDSISKPIDYRMDDGTQAVRILYYKGSTRPHQANLKDDYQKIYNAALNEKKARILSDWFDKAKKQVFIDVDKEYDYCSIMY